MLRPVWDVMMLLHDDVTVVGRASAFVNWQFTYYNTHGSDWGTFALKTDFALLSKQCIGFFSILLYCKSKPTSLWRWQHVKVLKRSVCFFSLKLNRLKTVITQLIYYPFCYPLIQGALRGRMEDDSSDWMISLKESLDEGMWCTHCTHRAGPFSSEELS